MNYMGMCIVSMCLIHRIRMLRNSLVSSECICLGIGIGVWKCRIGCTGWRGAGILCRMKGSSIGCRGVGIVGR